MSTKAFSPLSQSQSSNGRNGRKFQCVLWVMSMWPSVSRAYQTLQVRPKHSQLGLGQVGWGRQTYSHRTILCDFLPISMMPYNFHFNFQEFWSLKTITISNIILNKYLGFKSINNYEHMNKSYHQRKLKFWIAH